MSRTMILAVVAMVAALGMLHPAQGAPQVLFRATAGSQPDVLVWVDSPEGTRTNPDDAQVKAFQDTFASTNWLFMDDRTLLIRQGDRLVASANWRALDNSNTFWALHNRREYTLDGSADRDPDDPTIGGATLYVTVPGDQGDSVTARVEVRLTFQN
jgi:hypothetical protein